MMHGVIVHKAGLPWLKERRLSIVDNASDAKVQFKRIKYVVSQSVS